jgi:hypothetical protein
MKHIKTYDEAVNEGFLSWLFKKIYKINFTVELTDKKTNEPFSYKSYLTVKAKDEDDAREKFDSKWEEAIKKFEKEPTVIIGNVKKVDKADRTEFDLPKIIKKFSDDKEVAKQAKQYESPKKEEHKKKEKKK